MPRGHHRRHFRREGGRATATINNKTEFERFVQSSTSVSISIMGGLNVNATNEGSANAFNNSEENKTHNEA